LDALATQNVLDPRRVGKQNSGFSDEDISDIICVLYPHSESARQEVHRLAQEDSPHVIGKDEVDVVEPDYELEDHASRFEPHPPGQGDYAIILRLSSNLKDHTSGFVFGRNHSRCDLVFVNDPYKRISNIHFRIYPNEYGNVMIEDQSTNGTLVDRNILSCQAKPGAVPRWVLSSGAMIKIYLHQQIRDLTFRVRIPRRDDEYETAYLNKINEYFTRHGLREQKNRAVPQNDGPPDIFRTPAEPLVNNRNAAHQAGEAAQHQKQQQMQQQTRSPAKKREPQQHREWNGSGKYNRIVSIGKGAFAVVYKVTAKYDGKPYAAKELDRRRFMKNGVLDQKVENEMKIMQRIKHVSQC
jgi:FHA domain